MSSKATAPCKAIETYKERSTRPGRILILYNKEVLDGRKVGVDIR